VLFRRIAERGRFAGSLRVAGLDFLPCVAYGINRELIADREVKPAI
jgi:hypothetical protein